MPSSCQWPDNIIEMNLHLNSIPCQVFGEDGQLSDSHSLDSPVNQPGRKIKFITCSDSELP